MGQFWVVEQDPLTGDNGIEADNWETNYTATPFSEPILANYTLIGADDGSANHGIRLRHGTKGKLYNGIIAGFTQGLRVGSECNAYAADGSLLVKNSAIFNNATAYNNADIFANDPSNSTEAVALSGYLGSDPNGAMDPSSLNSWFSTAIFKGAVESGNDWTIGWTRQL